MNGQPANSEASGQAPRSALETQPVNNRARHQTRGMVRRGKILAAARELIESNDKVQLSNYEVAERAGIPPSSLYHFFPKVADIYSALLEDVFLEFERCVEEPLPDENIQCWADIGFIIESRMQEYYRQSDIARKLILGQHAFGELLAADKAHDDELGSQIQQIYSHYFHLPPLPDSYNIFTIALQVADRVYAMSHQTFGNLTDAMAQEGWKVAKAYLSLYLPEHLMAKPR